MRYTIKLMMDFFFLLYLVLFFVASVWEYAEIKLAAEDTNGKIPEPNQKSVLCVSADYQSPFLYIKHNYIVCQALVVVQRFASILILICCIITLPRRFIQQVNVIIYHPSPHANTTYPKSRNIM